LSSLPKLLLGESTLSEYAEVGVSIWLEQMHASLEMAGALALNLGAPDWELERSRLRWVASV